MGYSTDFFGKFNLNKKLDKETYTFLTKLAYTRRMRRKMDSKYGVEGELFVDAKGSFGQDDGNPNIIDYNSPPKTQPGLWCQWRPTKDGLYIEWDGNEKFYSYIEWLQYIIDKILTPKNYELSGLVRYQGEDAEDNGYIVTLNKKTFSMPLGALKVIGNKDPIKFLKNKKNLPLLIGLEDKFDTWIGKELKE